jgi:ABC-type phosphate transport system auxiliary subunit
MSTAGKRRPPPYVLDALACLARSGERRLPTSRFEMMLIGVQWPRQTIQRTILALERRGWINVYGGIIVLTDEGHAAATQGIGVVQPKKREPGAGMRQRVRSTRMPRGLF